MKAVVVSFGTYEVDLEQVEIRRDGRSVPVQPQVFSVIEYLIDQRHRVVSKEDLLDNVWGDRFVSESALTSRIKSARRALGDSGTEQNVIRTVLGRGYRFVADVDTLDGDSAELAPATAEPLPKPQAAAAPKAAGAQHESLPDEAWPLVGRQKELATVERHYLDRAVPGVVITGPEHIGATRFVEACRAYAEQNDCPTARVMGLSSAVDIPLAAVTHLISDDVLATDQTTGDLARAGILRRASRALQTQAGDQRMLVIIENAHLLDSMSATLLTNLMLSGSLFGLAIRQRLAGGVASSTGQDGLLHEMRLQHLTETDIDILLHRVLGGPVAPASLRQIIEASTGRPGLVIDIVETSRAAQTLVRDHGVWRLTGPLASTATQTWDPTAYSDDAVKAAEVLALVPMMPEAKVAEICGDRPLEELDAGHLLALEGSGANLRVGLVEPLLASAIRAAISPLRERRLKRELATALLHRSSSPTTIATVIGWGLDDVAPEPSLILAAAQTAMADGDLDTAGNLAEYLQPSDDPSVHVIAAEVALLRSQWDRAEQLFGGIDIEQLDEVSAAHVLRRQAAIQFYTRFRFDETIDWLESQAERREGQPARALRARRVGMLAFLGRASQSMAAAAELGELRGLTAIEVLLSTATADLFGGQFQAALSTVDRVEELLKKVPDVWADEPRDAILTLRCSALTHLGRLEEASKLVRQSLPVGKRTTLGYFPSVAAGIEMMAGRPKAARELVRQSIQTSHRDAFPQYVRVAEAVFAETDLALGRREKAEAGLEKARAAFSVTSGELQWLLSIMTARLASGLGQPDPADLLLKLADEAQSAGAAMREADLLVHAALFGDSNQTAAAVADRVSERVADFDGMFWSIRDRHVRALAAGDPLEPIEDDYRRLGFVGLV